MNTMGMQELSAGDIILYHSNSLLANLIQFFDGTEVNHASVCIGDGKVVEAVGAGIKCNTIRGSIRDAEYVIVRRMKTDPGTMQPVVDKANWYLQIGNRYGYEQLVLLAILGLTRKLQVNNYLSWLLRKIFDQAADILMKQGDRQPMICSEFVYRCYDEALPVAHDPYCLDIALFPGLMRDAIKGVRGSKKAPESGNIHRDSLLVWACNFAGSRSFLSDFLSQSSGKRSQRALSAEEKRMAKMSIDDLASNYLKEVKKPKTRSLELEASLRSPQLLQSIYEFSKSFYAVTAVGNTATAPRSLEKDIPSVLDHLLRTVADFVTPGDLYKCDNLSSIGRIS